MDKIEKLEKQINFLVTELYSEEELTEWLKNGELNEYISLMARKSAYKNVLDMIKTIKGEENANTTEN